MEILIVLIALTALIAGVVYGTWLVICRVENETPACNGKKAHMLGPWQDGQWTEKHYSKGLGKGYSTRMEMEQRRTCIDCGLTEKRDITRSGAPKARYVW